MTHCYCAVRIANGMLFGVSGMLVGVSGLLLLLLRIANAVASRGGCGAARLLHMVVVALLCSHSCMW